MNTPAKDSRRKPRKHAVSATAEKKSTGVEHMDLEKRLQAIDLVFGMWRERNDVPKDGLAFQQEIRAEW